MAEIKVKAVYDGKDVSTGLQRLKGEAERTSEEIGRKLNRRFGAPEVFKGILQGIGIGSVDQIKDFIVAPWKDAADQAERLAKNSAAAVDAQKQVLAATNAGRTDSQRVGIAETSLGELTRTMERMEERVNKETQDTLLQGKGARWWNNVSGETKDRQMRADDLAAVREEVSQKTAELIALRRAAVRQDEGDLSSISEMIGEHNVRLGNTSAVQNAADNTRLARQQFDTIKADSSRSGEVVGARERLLRAEYAEEDARNLAARRFAEGVNPVISASSLARLGGGGNVNAFGGRETAAERELRQQTTLLRSIDRALNNTAAKNGLNDVSP